MLEVALTRFLLFIYSMGVDDLTTKWTIDESKFKNEVEYITNVPISWANLAVIMLQWGNLKAANLILTILLRAR